MVAYRKRDGLERVCMLTSSLFSEVREHIHRHRVALVSIFFFGVLFIALVTGETLFASMIFAIIQVEILGQIFSGAAFAMIVPTVIGSVHLLVHREGDHFTKWWLKKLSAIGVFIFAIGLSSMVGFSAWQAAQDAAGVISDGATGTIGGEAVGGEDYGSPGMAAWIGMIPNSLLFLGLSFGMIITINFASFCLGRALEAFNLIMLSPKIGDEILERIEALNGKIAAFRKLLAADEDATRKLPFDVKSKFAREASNAAWKVAQAKLSAARRKFRTENDPIADINGDPEAASIPSGITSEPAFAAHVADQMDQFRHHNLIRILTGLHTDPEEE